MDLLLKHLLAEITPKLKNFPPSQNDSYRIFHGRGQTYPGLEWLNIDAFGQLILITVFRLPNEQEVDFLSIFSQQLSQTIIQHDQAIEHVLIQRRDIPGSPFEALLGDVPDKWLATRKGLNFELSFSQQNIGYFIDIEPLRVWLEENAQDKNILNLFSYTCAFSVVAMHAGAQAAVNIDMSRKSLDRGRYNHKINKLPTDNVKFFAHDIFKSWGKLRKYGPYDIVICDPPSFQKGSFVATKDYAKVLKKMEGLVADDGCFVACLNAPEISASELKAWVNENCPQFVCKEILPHDKNCPELTEEAGLKMLVCQR